MGRYRNSGRRTLIALALAVAVSGALASGASAEHQVSKPIVFVHGLDFNPLGGNGVPCEGNWGAMMDTLRAKGWTGTFYPVTYYHEDGTCSGPSGMVNSNIDHHGDHATFVSGGHRDGSHTTDTSIRHLAYHWAWWVYDHHTRYDRAVEAVGHSMGGLIVRYAVNAVQRGFSGFPSKLLVEDIVTYGTPHDGVNNARFGYVCGVQCDELDSSSTFIDYLRRTAQNPQSAIATRWSVIGAGDDDRVTIGSAMAMNAMHKVWYYTGEGDRAIEHGDYMNRTSWLHSAHVQFKEDGATSWAEGTNGKWPVRLAAGYMAHTNGCPHAFTLCRH